eukprot:TRINITY_DN13159_c0_g1_i1.p1 TRINITY_DN13159_c0_g1~~TRINITY_DN13159_c0_g1_i1.p1  ORF type:complete len:413 (+),score=84.28 TRINITY_DN13159_c0_g1_i1:63-1241(+)
MEGVFFDASELHGDCIQVQILLLSGETFSEAFAQQQVTVHDLKRAIASKFELTLFEFKLTSADCDETAEDALLSHLSSNSTSSLSESTGTNVLSLYMVKGPTTLADYEDKAVEEWRDLATKLQDKAIDDTSMHFYVCKFLDKYPALINWQTRCSEGQPFKPLLSFAVNSFDSTELRQLCVDELIRRGARVRIRHEQGFLIEEARRSNSAFVHYLEQKEKELSKYEKESIEAWRSVSSRLCGETRNPVDDEEEMTKIVVDFCSKYPDMVNFQNNHAVDEGSDIPYGYFGYAPLLSFAGVQGRRKGSVEALLRHGARVDTEHGSRTSMEWLQSEGSQLVGWLQEQLQAPMPLQAAFNLERSASETNARSSVRGVLGDALSSIGQRLASFTPFAS